MVYTLGNLIIDFLLYIEGFPVQARALQGVSHVAIGPGGACNVAIMASRFGLPVACLGEIGDDYFGQIVLSGLDQENVRTSHILVKENGTTPVAGVLVDPQSEPAYLGYPGEAALQDLPPSWAGLLQKAQGLFVDGWIEYPAMSTVILTALRKAREAGVMTFFDPGPGNPRQDRAWQRDAAALASVVLATEAEIGSLTEIDDPAQGAQKLLTGAASLVVVKRGAEGCSLYTRDEVVHVPGLPLVAVDATGAGDSLAGAVIYGCLHGLSLLELGTLANATGGAKVLKIGTGHEVPTTAEIQALLDRFDLQIKSWPA